MADIYGTKVSQRGFDVRTCADYQLVYSSEWPLLKIQAQGSVIIPDATQDVTISTHGLGYVPAFWVFDDSTYADTWAGAKMAYPGTSQFLAANATDLKWLGASRGAIGGILTIYYYIFRSDLSTSFTAQVFNSSPTVAGTDSDYGIKVAKPGFDVSNSDFRNFTIRSDCRSPMVHKTGTGSFGALGGSVTITHGLGYEPMYYFWAKLTAYGDGRYQMVTTAEDSFSTATSSNITLSLPYQCDYSYMIFKDPMLLN